MGNILSRKNTYDVTTYEGWDKKMQEIAESIDKTIEEQKRNKQLQLRCYWCGLYFFILFLLSIAISIYIYKTKFYRLWTVHVLLCVVLCIIKLVQYLHEKRSKRLENLLHELQSNKTGHLNKLMEVKACAPDILKLTAKYNIDNRYFSSPELESQKKDIHILLETIRLLLALPLCKDCRYYSKEGRDKILENIPSIYRSRIQHIEPQHAENIPKPLDEKIMQLLGEDDRNEPVVMTTAMLLEDHSNESNPSDEVIVEEIITPVESKEEEVVNSEMEIAPVEVINLDEESSETLEEQKEGVRKRQVDKDNDCTVLFQ